MSSLKPSCLDLNEQYQVPNHLPILSRACLASVNHVGIGWTKCLQWQIACLAPNKQCEWEINHCLPPFPHLVKETKGKQRLHLAVVSHLFDKTENVCFGFVFLSLNGFWGLEPTLPVKKLVNLYMKWGFYSNSNGRNTTFVFALQSEMQRGAALIMFVAGYREIQRPGVLFGSELQYTHSMKYLTWIFMCFSVFICWKWL